MNDKIKKLKDLAIAYECAINYDYVPDKYEAEEIFEEILPSYMNPNIEEIERILEEYEGNSDRNITNLILKLIKEL